MNEDCDCPPPEREDACSMGGDHNCVKSSINSGALGTCSKCGASC